MLARREWLVNHSCLMIGEVNFRYFSNCDLNKALWGVWFRVLCMLTDILRLQRTCGSWTNESAIQYLRGSEANRQSKFNNASFLISIHSFICIN